MYSLSLWLALGAFGMALGCPWVDFGAHLAPFGLPLGPLGVPWGCLGGALGCSAQFSQICRKKIPRRRNTLRLLGVGGPNFDKSDKIALSTPRHP